MTARGERVARGSLAAAVAVFVAALFHSAAGGGVPSVLALTLSLAFAIPVCSVLAGRHMALWRLGASVISSQFALHLLFGLGASGDSFAGATAHLHAGAHLTLIAGTSTDTMSRMATDSPWMWAGHISAALVTIAALRYGETSVRSAMRSLAVRAVLVADRLGFGAALAASAVTAPDAATRPIAGPLPILLPATRIALSGLRHRGPPALATFA
jgi:hypothetical protein